MLYENWIKDAIKLYKEGKKFYQIGNELGIGRKTVSYHLKKLGYEADQKYVRNVNPEKLRKYDYTVADSRFEIIDTEEKAYWLGFLYADGYVSKSNNIVSLALAEEDEAHLKKFRAFMGLEEKRLTKKYRKMNGKKYLSYEFAVSSQKIKDDLCNLGCQPQKTFNIKFPDDEKVPPHLKHHFVRGYFDGDGCITESATSALSLEILGTLEFLKGYQAWTGIRLNKIHSFNTTEIKHCMHAGFAAIQILDKLYKDATVFLERKHEKYLTLRRLRLKTVRRPKSIIVELSGEGCSEPSPSLKALLAEADRLQQCN